MYYGSMTARNPLIAPGKSGLTSTQIRDLATDTHKHCSWCGEFKSLEEFGKQTRGLKGRHAACLTCMRPYQTSWAAGNVDRATKQRRAKVVRVYGVEALAVLDRIDAGEPCEVCGRRSTKMPIDHDHQTGRVRGLLCHNCNTALGLANESVEVLYGLISYLNLYSTDTSSVTTTRTEAT